MAARAKEGPVSKEGLDAAEERQSTQERFEGQNGDPEGVEVFRDPSQRAKWHVRDAMCLS